MLEIIFKIANDTLNADNGMAFTADKSLESVGFDSLSYLTLVVNLEERFDVKFDEEMLVLGKITFFDLHNHIIRKKKDNCS